MRAGSPICALLELYDGATLECVRRQQTNRSGGAGPIGGRGWQPSAVFAWMTADAGAHADSEPRGKPVRIHFRFNQRARSCTQDAARWAAVPPGAPCCRGCELVGFLSGRAAFQQPDKAVAAQSRSPGLDQAPRLLDGFRVIGTRQPHNPTKCPSLPTKYADSPPPTTWILPGINAFREQVAMALRYSRGQTRGEDNAGSVVMGHPAVIFVGGVGYFLVHATH